MIDKMVRWIMLFVANCLQLATKENMKPKVMFVDPSAHMRSLFHREAKKIGWIVYEAIDGEDALRKIDKVEYIGIDLLVTEIEMPSISGVELIATLRKKEKTKHLSIFICTGISVPASLIKEIEADGVLRKDLNFFDGLTDMLKRLRKIYGKEKSNKKNTTRNKTAIT